MLEDVEASFTEDLVRDVLRDSAGRASAHIAEVSDVSVGFERKRI
jgi:hypothetical protein